jgi:hypothetical protein
MAQVLATLMARVTSKVGVFKISTKKKLAPLPNMSASIFCD